MISLFELIHFIPAKAAVVFVTPTALLFPRARSILLENGVSAEYQYYCVLDLV